MKIPEQMSLIELVGEKVMLFTCETRLVGKPLSFIWIVTMFLRGVLGEHRIFISR